MGDVLVIIPTYNEAENLPQIVPAVLERNSRFEILVVDDGSPDGTGELADEMAEGEERLHVLHRPGKLGLGTAYLAGFRWALERDYELVFEMDADFSHDPDHLPDFLNLAEEYDLVVGSRYTRGVTVVNWPMGRLLLSWLANKYAKFVTGLDLNDVTSGFKCYHRDVLEALDLRAIRSNGYAFQIETVFRTWHAGFRVVETPIVFVDRNVGVSKMSKRIVWEAIWMVWRMRWWKITGRLERETIGEPRGDARSPSAPDPDRSGSERKAAG
ncbi:MAG: polyprenol monophosphomannose synthase [Gemmatimonadota bacterium]|nr:polyprenol monophosphomannose synthase [Gemmatimonadota bacterium]